MNNSRIEGIGHQLKGTLKQGLGNIIGDIKLTADGAAERIKGEAQLEAIAAKAPLGGIDPDRIKGVAHQLEGAIKAGLGNIINNPELIAAGNAERERGKAQNAAGSARDEAREAPKP